MFALLRACFGAGRGVLRRAVRLYEVFCRWESPAHERGGGDKDAGCVGALPVPTSTTFVQIGPLIAEIYGTPESNENAVVRLLSGGEET